MFDGQPEAEDIVELITFDKKKLTRGGSRGGGGGGGGAMGAVAPPFG